MGLKLFAAGVLLSLSVAPAATAQDLALPMVPVLPVLPSRDTNPYSARIAQLEQQLAERERQLVDRQNEVLHQRTDLANCKATVDSLELTSEVGDLVKRYEAAYGGTWTWDDKSRRVVKLPPPKEHE